MTTIRDYWLSRARLGAALRRSGLLREALDSHGRTFELLDVVVTWPVAAGAMSELGLTMGALAQLNSAIDVHASLRERLRATARRIGQLEVEISMNPATLRAAGRHVEALEIQSAIIRQASAALGPHSPAEFLVLGQRAIALGTLGDFSAARRDWERVAIGRREQFGSRDLGALLALVNLAVAEREMGAAEQEQVVTVIVRLIGPRHPGSLSALQTLAAVGDHGRARELTEHVIAGRSAVLGANHPQTLATLRMLAGDLRRAGDPLKARRFAEQAVQGLTSSLGGDHPDTILAPTELAEILAESDLSSESRTARDRILDLNAARPGSCPTSRRRSRADVPRIVGLGWSSTAP